jgi:hypothetical protein
VRPSSSNSSFPRPTTECVGAARRARDVLLRLPVRETFVPTDNLRAVDRERVID